MRQTMGASLAFHSSERLELNVCQVLEGMTTLSCMHLRLLTITQPDSTKSEAASERSDSGAGARLV